MKQVTKNGRNLFRAKVFFKRVATEEEAQNVQIQDGQLLYVKETGNTYMDYGAERISTGGGSSKGSGIPIGTVIEWHSDTLPTDGTWLWTDHEYLKADYPDLYTFCGDRFNKEDTPSNSFRTPNRAGLVAIGVGTYTDKNEKEVTITLGDVVGEFEHEQTVEEVANHSHKVRYTGEGANGRYGGMAGTSVDASPEYNDLLVAYEGGSQPFNVTQPSIGVNYIIKAVKSTELETGEVVNSLATSSTTNAPSVDAVNSAIELIGNYKFTKNIFTKGSNQTCNANATSAITFDSQSDEENELVFLESGKIKISSRVKFFIINIGMQIDNAEFSSYLAYNQENHNINATARQTRWDQSVSFLGSGVDELVNLSIYAITNAATIVHDTYWTNVSVTAIYE